MSGIAKMAMAKPLAFGRAGGPGSHLAKVGVMAKPAIFFKLPEGQGWYFFCCQRGTFMLCRC